MPIFHFNVHDGVSLPDQDGENLPDLAAARAVALDLACDLFREMGPEFWHGKEWKMDVTDGQGVILFSLTFFASQGVAAQGTEADERD